MPSIIGTNVNDVLRGSNSKDTVLGFDGDDVAEGRGGDDTLDGGFGNDTLFGGAGNDTLIDRFGFNWLYGGGGNDFIGVNDGSRHLDDSGVGAVIYGDGFNSFTLIAELIQGESNTASTQLGDDTIYGTAGADIIFGDNGDPTNFSAAGGNDSIFAGHGADFIDGEGGNDLVYGEEGNDTLFGGEGKDTVAGGMGDDVLTGGRGADLIDGGVGYDRIIYNTISDSTGNKIDTVFNFESALNYAAGDKIDLSALVGPSGETIRWTDSAASPLGAWCVRTNDGLLLLVDATGDASADLRVAFFGTDSLKHSDILGVANHAPLLIGGHTVHGGTVIEHGGAFPAVGHVVGSITSAYSDLDGDVLATTSSGVLQGAYGTLTLSLDGSWQYLLDNTSQETQALKDGDLVTETFRGLRMTDGLLLGDSINLVIDVMGANDAAIITGDTFGFTSQFVLSSFPQMIQDGPPATGDLHATDVDDQADAFQAVSAPTRSTKGYGTYTMTESGVWVYTLDNANPAVQQLDEGELTTDTFTVYSEDGTGQTVTIQISGGDDLPKLIAPATQTAYEDTALIFSAANGNQIAVSDVDSDVLYVSITPLVLPFGSNALFSLNGTAGLSFSAGGGTDDRLMMFSGSAQAINNALDGLSLSTGHNFHGLLGFSIRASDGSLASSMFHPEDVLVVSVTSINDAPTGLEITLNVNEDTPFTLTPYHFAFWDAESASSPFAFSAVNALAGVKINTLPMAGSLTLSGLAVTEGQLVTRADLDAGRLTYLPGQDAKGSGYASFTFQVQDNGGTAHGGIDLDPTPNTVSINVNSLSDAPNGTDTTVVTNKNTNYVFKLSDFGFSDVHDSPPDAFTGVKITSLPTAGVLGEVGQSGLSALNAGAFVTVSSITAGRLVFIPQADAAGADYSSFTFQVRDNGVTTGVNTSYVSNGGYIDGGGLAGGGALPHPVHVGTPSGANLDPTPNKLTIDVADIVGTEDDDELIGSAIANRMLGLGGDDLLIGGQDADTMTGGDGSDTFKFTQDGGADRITDFTVAPIGLGGDVLDISELLAAIQWTPETLNEHVIASFLGFSSGGQISTVIGVDQDGAGPGFAQPVVTLVGVMAFFQDLMENHQVVT